MLQFDLVTQPWVPCLRDDGAPVELSLLDTLRQAHRLVEIADPSPMVTVALLRLLVAIVVAALRPTRDDWRRLWQAPALPLDALAAYLTHHRPAFDLFSANRPFYQVRGLPRRLAVPVQRLTVECASGRRPTLFDHHRDDRPRPVPPATAARWLLAQHSFCPSGCLGSETGSGLVPAQAGPLAYAAVVLPTGDSLRQTLLLNLLPTEALAPWLARPGGAADHAAWETPAPTPTASGYLHHLTRPSRRVELLPDSAGNVATAVITPGPERPADPPARDPWLAYHVGSGHHPRLAAVRVEPGGGGWRDLPLFLRSTPNRRRPLVIDWLAEQSLCGVIAPQHVLGLRVLGLEGSGRRLGHWQRRQCQLPAALLADADRAADLYRALERAVEYHEALQAGRWMMAQGKAAGRAGRAPDDAPLGRLAAGEGGGYWEALETPMQLLALRLQGPEAEREAALRWWDGLCRQTSWACLERQIDRAGGSARLLRDEVAARRHLARRGGGAPEPLETDLDTAV